MGHQLIFIIVGLLLGFLSGLFGVGGSSIATPILRLMDVPRMFALATPLPVTLPIAIVGGFTYWRRGLVDNRTILWTTIGGLPSVIAGSYMTTIVPGRFLMMATGVCVMAVGIRMFFRPIDSEFDINRKTPPAAWFIVIVGSVVGLLSGMLANGGGFLLMPVYLILFGLEPRRAAATSLVTVALFALPATLVHWSLGHIDPGLMLLLAISVIPTTWLGARVGLMLKDRQAQFLFGLFLFAFGLFFTTHTFYRAQIYGWLN